MRMTTRVAAAGVAGVLGLAGLGLGVTAPLAAAATSAAESAGDAVGGRLQAIKDALSGLVEEGTITQEQADQVAETLEGSDVFGPRGHGGHGGFRSIDLDAAAEALDLSAEELREALATEGTTLSDIAQDQGVAASALVDALVAAATERLEEGVASGRLTQEQADERIAALPERVEAAIQEEFRGGRGGGPGHRHGAAPGGEDGDTDSGSDTGTEGSTSTEDASFTA